MGTLRIKRGTKTALQSNPGYVPAEGELVYTTDTKEVFVGDGALTGGTPVSVSTQNLEDLGNVQALAAQNDQILVYNGSQWAATDNPAVDVRGNIYGDDSTLLVDAINGKIVAPVETTSVTATNLVGNLTGDVTGSVTGNVVGNTTGTHFGNVNGSVDGDVTGSVFADDSSPIVDAISRDIFANDLETFRVTNRTGTLTLREISTANNHRIEITGTKITFKADTTASEIVSQNHNYSINKTDTNPIINVGRIESTGTVGTEASIGRITFSKTDTDGTKTPFQFEVNKTYMTIFPNPTGTPDYTKFFKVYNNGKTQVGGEAGGSGYAGMSREPAAQLEVVGNVKISGANELLLGNMTTTERNALTAANGMIIYNTSDNKFQGYENGAWVNLI